MRLGKRQKKIISVLEGHPTDETALARIFNYQPSEIRQIICSIENKRNNSLIKNDKNSLSIRSEDSEKNFAKQKTRQEFYFAVRKSNMFKNECDYILIETEVFFYHIFNASVQENESLQALKHKNLSAFNRLYKGLLENLHYQVILLKRKVAGWSEGKYEVILDTKSNKLKIIDSKTKAVCRFKSNYQKPNLEESKIICECLFLFQRTLKEILDNSISLATRDYTSF